MTKTKCDWNIFAAAVIASWLPMKLGLAQPTPGQKQDTALAGGDAAGAGAGAAAGAAKPWQRNA